MNSQSRGKHAYFFKNEKCNILTKWREMFIIRVFKKLLTDKN